MPINVKQITFSVREKYSIYDIHIIYALGCFFFTKKKIDVVYFLLVDQVQPN